MGRDLDCIFIDYIQYNFNPRALVGRDGFGNVKTYDGEISIHAPSWGATDKLFDVVE